MKPPAPIGTVPPAATAADRELLARIEVFYDAIPRDAARAEDFGPLALFLRNGPGFPYYARPTAGAPPATVADVDAVRARQREAGAPEAFEWVHDLNPELAAAVEATGLPVRFCPLMVLEPLVVEPAPAPPGVTVTVLDPADPAFAEQFSLVRTVANLGFELPGTATGTAGTAERDAAYQLLDEQKVAEEAIRAARHRSAHALATSDTEGALAAGGLQQTGGVSEIVGVATLPAYRRRGLGAAVTHALARDAVEHGDQIVFMAAGDEAVARVYARIGFRRIATACIAEL